MLIRDIIKGVNHRLAGEMLTFREMLPHLDATIDDINADLNATFPAFSELPEGATEYSFFPDKYIRTAVFTGAAHYFYMTDEEGGLQDPGYLTAYTQSRFLMVRDYLRNVPVAYKASDLQGSVAFNLTGVEEEGIYSIDFYSLNDL